MKVHGVKFQAQIFSLSRLQSGLGNLSTKNQAYGQVFHSRALNLDRFLWTGFFQSRISDNMSVLSKTCQRFCFLSFNTVLFSCLKLGSEKSLSRETCLDLELWNEKPVCKPVFCRQVANPRLQFYLTSSLVNDYGEEGNLPGADAQITEFFDTRVTTKASVRDFESACTTASQV
jgi:hypothetical protein